MLLHHTIMNLRNVILNFKFLKNHPAHPVKQNHEPGIGDTQQPRTNLSEREFSLQSGHAHSANHLDAGCLTLLIVLVVPVYCCYYLSRYTDLNLTQSPVSLKMSRSNWLFSSIWKISHGKFIWRHLRIYSNSGSKVRKPMLSCDRSKTTNC